MSGNVVIMIPARMASVRFPGKPLANRTGWPLIRHVWEAARGARCATRMVVATDDERIAGAVREFGGEAVMTRTDHPNGTSRLAEAAGAMGLAADDLVVNVQGDEPELDPALIDAAVDVLRGSGAPMATVAVPFGEDEDPRDPNVVKVVRRADGTAIYFSRSLIPFVRDPDAGPHTRPLKHLGLYAYRRPFLDTYLALAPTPLERAESLEQLRVLEHGHAIAVAVGAARAHAGIDTPEQYGAFVARWLAAHG